MDWQIIEWILVSLYACTRECLCVGFKSQSSKKKGFIELKNPGVFRKNC